MTAQPKQNNQDRPIGLAASWSPVDKQWQAAGHGVPIPPEVGARMFGGQMAQSEIKMPMFTKHPFAVKLLDGSWWLRSEQAVLRNTLRDEQLSADKSSRHPLAQAWRDATPTPSPSPIAIGEGNAPVEDELACSTSNLQPLLLTAGELPVALLSAGDEIPVQPTPDMEALEDAMARAELESRIQWVDYTETRPKFIEVGLALPEPNPITNDQVEAVPADSEPVISNDTLEASALATIAATTGYPDKAFIQEFGVTLLADLLGRGLIYGAEGKLFIKAQASLVSVEPSPAKPIAQNLDPLADAVRTKQLRRNTTKVYSFAREICNDGNEVHAWLKENFGINAYSLVTEEQVVAVEGAVVAERLKYAKAGTIAELNAYGIAVHGSMTWTGSVSSGATKYSCGRTRFPNRLYQEQAEAWLMDLKKRATPQQLIDAGRRMESERGKAMRFASSGRTH